MRKEKSRIIFVNSQDFSLNTHVFRYFVEKIRKIVGFDGFQQIMLTECVMIGTKADTERGKTAIWPRCMWGGRLPALHMGRQWRTWCAPLPCCPLPVPSGGQIARAARGAAVAHLVCAAILLSVACRLWRAECPRCTWGGSGALGVRRCPVVRCLSPLAGRLPALPATRHSISVPCRSARLGGLEAEDDGSAVVGWARLPEGDQAGR